VAYITFPNFDSLASREYKDKWEFKSFPNHLFYFTRRSIEALLEKVGLKILELNTHEGESTSGGDLEILRRKLPLSDEEASCLRDFLHGLGLGPEWKIIASKPK